MTFEDLYNRLLKAAVNSKMPEELNLIENEGYDPHHLDCLINPYKHE
ncbi:MAG TPA: iron hydrogenase, partial [Clostridium sp.]|nr:iron hydrogenase [Clostridium sp.]